MENISCQLVYVPFGVSTSVCSRLWSSAVHAGRLSHIVHWFTRSVCLFHIAGRWVGLIVVGRMFLVWLLAKRIPIQRYLCFMVSYISICHHWWLSLLLDDSITYLILVTNIIHMSDPSSDITSWTYLWFWPILPVDHVANIATGYTCHLVSCDTCVIHSGVLLTRWVLPGEP